MAATQRTLIASAGALDDIDSTQRNPLGLIDSDAYGNEYVYVKGVASVAQGDWGIFYSDYSTARALNTPLPGRVGVYMSALVASKFGWMQISGLVSSGTLGNGVTNANIATDASGDTKPLFLSATAGRLTTTVAAGNAVLGAFCSGNPASNTGAAFISRPFAAGFTLASA